MRILWLDAIGWKIVIQSAGAACLTAVLCVFMCAGLALLRAPMSSVVHLVYDMLPPFAIIPTVVVATLQAWQQRRRVRWERENRREPNDREPQQSP